ncbi:MAG: NYN domain-containing protein [Candidatus Pacebacteria bacterium]|nr:NYN domain-containing protein [Candidatus Paceibacterota bacterium]
MKKKALLIDWENFKYKIKTILKENKKPINYSNINYQKLFQTLFPESTFDEKICFMARLKKHEKFPEKSLELIESQRFLKMYLEKQGFEVVMCGVVRAHETDEGTVFKEKGVDVYMAVDIVKKSFSHNYSDIVVVSSDSDMNPAIKEAQNQKTKITYVGFQKLSNKGIMYNSDQSILIRDNEILENIQQEPLHIKIKK